MIFFTSQLIKRKNLNYWWQAVGFMWSLLNNWPLERVMFRSKKEILSLSGSQINLRLGMRLLKSSMNNLSFLFMSWDVKNIIFITEIKSAKVASWVAKNPFSTWSYKSMHKMVPIWYLFLFWIFVGVFVHQIENNIKTKSVILARFSVGIFWTVLC